MTIGSLFSGIGGLELGLEMCGMGPVKWQCDSDPAARAVLAKHWPNVRRYEDVRAIDGAAEKVDIICGGFPCQPVSCAGKRKAQKDTRWLWPFFASVVDVLRPKSVFIENVPGLRTAGLRDVLADLADLGFDAQWGCFSAEDVGAPHRRKRMFLLAYTDGEFLRKQQGRRSGQGGTGAAESRRDGKASNVANTNCQPDHVSPAQGCDLPGAAGGSWWAVEPDVGRVAYGVQGRVDRLRLLGNAVVPQQAALAWRTLSSMRTIES